MDARLADAARRGVVALVLLAAPLAFAQTDSAPTKHEVSFRQQSGYRTQNFVVRAPTRQLAQEIGDEAERLRVELAHEWIGQTLPNWTKPCPITAQVAPQLGAGGATSFVFDRGQVYDWRMDIQGSRERVLDSVLPHEVTHTIFASYFRKPLPRWADEGACTTVEHHSEIAKQEARLVQYLKTGKGIPFSRMFAMKEYPRDILPLYAQGHSLTQYLMESHGKQAFLEFLTDGMRDDNWRRAVQTHYGRESLYALQQDWLAWVADGRPRLTPGTINDSAVVAAAPTRPKTESLAAAPSVYAPRAAGKAPTRASVYDASRRGNTVWR